MKPIQRLLLVLPVLIGCASQVHAASATWTATGAGAWNNNGNWNAAYPSASSDVATFNTNATVSSLGANISIGDITDTAGTNTVTITDSSFGMTLNNAAAISLTAGDVMTFNTSVSMANSGTTTLSVGAAQLVFNGSTSITNTLNITGASGSVYFNSGWSDSKRMLVGKATVYDGGSVGSGGVYLGTSTGSGSQSSAFYLTTNGLNDASNMYVAEFGSGGASNNVFTIGTAISAGGTATYSGAFSIDNAGGTAAGVTVLSAATNNTMIVTSLIGGGSTGGVLQFNGGGVVQLNGSANNSYTTTTAANANEVGPSSGNTVLQLKDTGGYALNGSTTVDGGSTIQLMGSSPNQMVSTATLTINGSGGTTGGGALSAATLGALESASGNNSLTNLVTQGSAATIAADSGTGLTLTGGINNAGYATTFAGSGSTTISTAGITGIGGLTKSGTGTLYLATTNSYTGATNDNAGMIYVTGSTNASSGFTIANGASLGGLGGTVNGSVSLSSGGSINLADGSIGTLHIGSLSTSGGGTFDFEIGGGTTATDLLADAGAFTASGTSTITIANLGGTAQTLTTGTYTLISGSTTALSSGNFLLSDATLDSKNLALQISGDNLTLVVTNAGPTYTTGTYTLAESVASSFLHTGQSTTATTTLTNTGTGSADSLNYTGLGATAGTGTLGTSSTPTGGPVNNASNPPNTASTTQTYTASSSAGTDTLTPNGSVTGANGTSAPVDSGTTTSVVTVYNGVGVWNHNGGGAWGTNEASATNWTATGGIPGITPGFLTTDSASFGSAATGGTATITLGAASPYLNAITFNDSVASYDIEQGGTGTIHLDSTGTATVTVSTGNDTIGAPIELDSAAATSVASSSTLTINGVISQSGTQSLVIGGGGTTVLGGSNSYSGGTTVNAGATLWVTNGTSGSATGTGTFAVTAGGTLGGAGTINSSSFAIGASGSRSYVTVGTGTDTTSGLTLEGSGANSITNTTLSFNIAAATVNQANVLNVGTSTITFSNSTLALNVSGTGVIPAFSSYTLIAGTGSSQYNGLGLTEESKDGTMFDVVTSGLGLSWSPALANTWYATNSFLYLNTAGGVDDIDVEVVPEPGTWALMLGGLAMLVFWQRRKTRQG